MIGVTARSASSTSFFLSSLFPTTTTTTSSSVLPNVVASSAYSSPASLYTVARAHPTTTTATPAVQAPVSSSPPSSSSCLPTPAAACISRQKRDCNPHLSIRLGLGAQLIRRGGDSRSAVRRPADLRRSSRAGKEGMQGGAVAESPAKAARPSRYESQKRRDWHTFGQYLRNHRPPLELSRCSGAHVLEFLRYLDQFGKTKVHAHGCPFFGHPAPPAPCPCPLRQAWGSLDALVGRLRAAFEEHGGRPEANPFGARAVRLYLREVRDTQAKARGIAYEKKRRKRPSSSSQKQQQQQQAMATTPPPPPRRTASPALSSDRSDSHVQQQQQQHAVVPPETQAHTHHFFIPHPQFLHHHGHFSLMPAGNAGMAVNGAAGTSSAVTTVGSSNGDEIALAMAAAAEAHAAGCMLPLSVFH